LQKRITEESPRRNLIRRSFLDFLELDGHFYWKTGRHHKIITDALQDVVNGKIKKLMIMLPPRHSKSETVTKKFPAWYLGFHPDKEMIISSYAADLSYDFSRIAKHTIDEWSDIFGTKLASDSQSVQRWGIEGHRGGLVAAGVGGPITGRGADIAIIDDPIKNRAEANSKTYRDRVWDWYGSTLRTRLSPTGAIILVMTRWHEDDLVGRLIQEQGDEWTQIKLPAIAEEDDPIGRELGEALWPERYSLEDLEEIKRDIGSFEFNALYQQRPSIIGGNIFKRDWFQYLDSSEVPKGLRLFQTIDLAISKRDTADYFALLTFGIDQQKNVYLLDLYVDHILFPEQVKIVTHYHNKWKPLRIGIESVQYQAALPQWLTANTAIPVLELKPSGDKVTRAMRITPHFENRKVYIVRSIPNKDVLEEQLTSFPNGANDDVVDTVSYIGDILFKLPGKKKRPKGHKL